MTVWLLVSDLSAQLSVEAGFRCAAAPGSADQVLLQLDLAEQRNWQKFSGRNSASGPGHRQSPRGIDRQRKDGIMRTLASNTRLLVGVFAAACLRGGERSCADPPPRPARPGAPVAGQAKWPSGGPAGVAELQRLFDAYVMQAGALQLDDAQSASSCEAEGAAGHAAPQ
jgi:hypothetical protein